MSGTDLAERIEVKPDLAEPGVPNGKIFTEKDKKWLRSKGIEPDTPDGFNPAEEYAIAKTKAFYRQRTQEPGGEEINEGLQQDDNFDPETAKKEYIKVHLNPFRRFLKFFRRDKPNKLEGITVGRDELKEKIERVTAPIYRDLAEGRLTPDQAQIELKKLGVLLKQEEIQKMAAEMYEHQKKNGVLGQEPSPTNEVRRPPQAPPKR